MNAVGRFIIHDLYIYSKKQQTSSIIFKEKRPSKNKIKLLAIYRDNNLAYFKIISAAFSTKPYLPCHIPASSWEVWGILLTRLAHISTRTAFTKLPESNGCMSQDTHANGLNKEKSLH